MSSRTDLLNLLRPLLKQTVTYRFLRGRELVAHGTGWVERIVMDQPDVSTYFTPLAICLNIDSFEHLEFETRPDQLIVYSLVQGDERVVIEFAPIDGSAARRRSRRASSNSTRAGSSRWSCSASSATSRTAVSDGRPVCGGRAAIQYDPRDVPVHRAARRAARDQRPGARVALRLGRRLCPGRLPPRGPGQAGVAHFMEHITFKGTAAYPTTRAISEAIEGVGGSFNAATERESTVYWVRVPAREAARGVDVLGELIVRPRLEDAEIDHERTVIVEEIRSYLDDPSEYAQILLQQALFGAGPLGREICGEEADIRSLPEQTIRDFWAATYRPTNIVVAVAGDLDHDAAVELVGPSLRPRATAPGPATARRPSLPAGERYLLGHRDASQAQLAMAVPAYRRDHPDAWPLAVLNGVLGDGMSSRLFLSVREERGLAYDVGSGVTEYADTGSLSIYAGVDPNGLEAALGGDPGRARAPARRARPGRRAGPVQGLPVGRARAADGRFAPRRLVARAARRRSTSGS